jgi:hypothetical protein
MRCTSYRTEAPRSGSRQEETAHFLRLIHPCSAIGLPTRNDSKSRQEPCVCDPLSYSRYRPLRSSRSFEIDRPCIRFDRRAIPACDRLFPVRTLDRRASGLGPIGFRGQVRDGGSPNSAARGTERPGRSCRGGQNLFDNPQARVARALRVPIGLMPEHVAVAASGDSPRDAESARIMRHRTLTKLERRGERGSWESCVTDS